MVKSGVGGKQLTVDKITLIVADTEDGEMVFRETFTPDLLEERRKGDRKSIIV